MRLKGDFKHAKMVVTVYYHFASPMPGKSVMGISLKKILMKGSFSLYWLARGRNYIILLY